MQLAAWRHLTLSQQPPPPSFPLPRIPPSPWNAALYEAAYPLFIVGHPGDTVTFIYPKLQKWHSSYQYIAFSFNLGMDVILCWETFFSAIENSFWLLKSKFTSLFLLCIYVLWRSMHGWPSTSPKETEWLVFLQCSFLTPRPHAEIAPWPRLEWRPWLMPVVELWNKTFHSAVLQTKQKQSQREGQENAFIRRRCLGIFVQHQSQHLSLFFVTNYNTSILSQGVKI